MEAQHLLVNVTMKVLGIMIKIDITQSHHQ